MQPDKKSHCRKRCNRRCPAQAFSRDGKKLAFAPVDGDVREWTIGTDAVKFLKQTSGQSCALTYNSKNELLVLRAKKNVVRLLNSATNQELISTFQKEQEVRQVVFSPDATRIAFYVHPTKVIVRDLRTDKQYTIDVAKVEWMWNLAFSPDGKIITATTPPSETIALNIESGEKLFTLGKFAHSQIVFSPDGDRLNSFGFNSDHGLLFWDARTGKRLDVSGGHVTPINRVLFSPDGKRILTSTLRAGPARLWDAKTGKLLRIFEGDSGAWRDILWSADGKQIVSTDYLVKAQVHFWDAQTLGKQRTITFETHRFSVGAFAFSSDGTRMATCGVGTIPDDVMLWDLASEKRLVDKPYVLDSIRDLFFLPGDKEILIEGFDEVRIIGLKGKAFESRRLIAARDGRSALSPDGRFLAHTGAITDPDNPPRAQIVEILTGKTVLDLNKSIRGYSVAFTSDGRTCAIGSGNAIRFIDLPSGEEFGSLKTGIGGPFAIAPNAKLLICPGGGYEQATPIIWDVDQLLNRPFQLKKKPEPSEVEKWCKELANSEPAIGVQAAWNLARVPGLAISALKSALRADLRPDPNEVEGLIAQLDDDRYRVREKAAKELLLLRVAIRKPIEKALNNSPTAEKEKRLRQILENLEKQAHSSEVLFASRATLALEQMGNAEAKMLLEEAAKSAASLPLREEAKLSLRRWKICDAKK